MPTIYSLNKIIIKVGDSNCITRVIIKFNGNDFALKYTK